MRCLDLQVLTTVNGVDTVNSVDNVNSVETVNVDDGAPCAGRRRDGLCGATSTGAARERGWRR